MRELAVRLSEGMDLKKSIQEIAKENNICAGVLLSAVGCVREIHLRRAKAQSDFYNKDAYEIVSVTGTIADNGVHIHISATDEAMNTVGGHLLEGTIIDTTCELVIGILEEFHFHREFDSSTGYKELVAKRID